ncbi:toll/interleukin-1 receptor domain-containing protein [Cohaesibacter celericrescens]|uniref:TIR domain-containing protein n=1 Tax=Cohaesibacter celericrescens TaxID=2067669 RepID=A0A2N5XQP3_9HYPH|nr:toll/interleukin-1 receptor domain-containing protein [Cohaesibacter celericrescens]PLW76829.1 hypothetical protein C0081_12270 [Cohaesibacter celericrescens]
MSDDISGNSINKAAVFFSYSASDEDLVMPFARALASNVDVIAPKVFFSGTLDTMRMTGGVDSAIKESDAVVLLVTPTSINSSMVLKEAELAIQYNKLLYPVVVTEMDVSTIPHPINIIQMEFARNQGEIERTVSLLRMSLINALQLQPQIGSAESVDLTSDTSLEILKSVPDQSSFVRFGVSENSKLSLVSTGVEENDYDTIEVFRNELLAREGPLQYLLDKFRKSNIPQAELYQPLIQRYEAELSKELRKVNYTVLYAIGTRIIAARAKAQVEETSGEWPAPGPIEAEAIDSVCSMHGPLIMASETGRKLVADAHQFETTPEIYNKEMELIAEFGAKVAAASEVVEAEAAEAIVDITAPIPNDPQLARNRGMRLMFASSALVVFVGGAAWVATASPLIGGLAAAGSGKFVWEVIKKTQHFKIVTDDLAGQLDRLTAVGGNGQPKLLEGISQFVEDNRGLIDKIAALRPEFEWAGKIIKTLEEKSKSEVETADDLSKLPTHIIFLPMKNQELKQLSIRLTGSIEVLVNKPSTTVIDTISMASVQSKDIDQEISHYLDTAYRSIPENSFVLFLDNSRSNEQKITNAQFFRRIRKEDGTSELLLLGRNSIVSDLGKERDMERVVNRISELIKNQMARLAS